MTIEQITAMQALAQRLPKYRQLTRRRLSAEELADMGYTEWEGRPLEAGRTYTVVVAHQTNHVRLLVGLYRRHGAGAVRQRLQGVADELTAIAAAK